MLAPSRSPWLRNHGSAPMRECCVACRVLGLLVVTLMVFCGPGAVSHPQPPAIHSTGLHDILNSGFGEACDEDRPASQCGCAARRSRSITWSSSSFSGIFVLLGTLYSLCPRLAIFLVSFLCSRVGVRGVPAFAVLCLFSSCWFGYGPWGPLAF